MDQKESTERVRHQVADFVARTADEYLKKGEVQIAAALYKVYTDILYLEL